VLLKNNIIVNNGVGLRVTDSLITLTENDIYDNVPYDIQGDNEGRGVNADDNWWGNADWRDLISRIRGRIRIEKMLNNSFPQGTSIAIPVLKPPFEGIIAKDSMLTLANSPARITKDVFIDQGATLFIQPGVQILFDKQTSIIVKDGGIVAKGDEMNPILFTTSSTSPSPGDYMNGVRFSEKTALSSFISYCIFRYGTTALDVYYGMPEITHSYIADNSQSGIRCRNDSAPRISYNTITRNQGSGGIECVGLAKPKINYNNFIDNTVAVQAFSTIYIDGRHNFWGKAPPDKTVIFGDNINIESWLEHPEKTAFCPDCDTQAGKAGAGKINDE
jgi:hypothetical protein